MVPHQDGLLSSWNHKPSVSCFGCGVLSQPQKSNQPSPVVGAGEGIVRGGGGGDGAGGLYVWPHL